MSVWIAARPQVVIPGVIDSNENECHITLAFLGSKVDPRKVKEGLETKQFNYQQNIWPDEPIVCEVTGTAQWVIPQGNRSFQVALVQPSIPKVGSTDIYDLRTRLVNKLNMIHAEPKDTFPFLPHITLPWRDASRDAPNGTPTVKTRHMFLIDKLYVCFTNPNYVTDSSMRTISDDPFEPEYISWELGQPIP